MSKKPIEKYRLVIDFVRVERDKGSTTKSLHSYMSFFNNSNNIEEIKAEALAGLDRVFETIKKKVGL
ncbi:MAG: hypothetical protein WC356_02180 [Candidatus Micrarchaeia archaeon]|jgi:hypothetical protein